MNTFSLPITDETIPTLRGATVIYALIGDHFLSGRDSERYDNNHRSVWRFILMTALGSWDDRVNVNDVGWYASIKSKLGAVRKFDPADRYSSTQIRRDAETDDLWSSAQLVLLARGIPYEIIYRWPDRYTEYDEETDTGNDLLPPLYGRLGRIAPR